MNLNLFLQSKHRLKAFFTRAGYRPHKITIHEDRIEFTDGHKTWAVNPEGVVVGINIAPHLTHEILKVWEYQEDMSKKHKWTPRPIESWDWMRRLGRTEQLVHYAAIRTETFTPPKMIMDIIETEQKLMDQTRRKRLAAYIGNAVRKSEYFTQQDGGFVLNVTGRQFFVSHIMGLKRSLK